ncbi:DUF72 domain-containing protein [Tengunoibacter tsumagoiensis]|uniref:DUF72 domain-containing protein n=1 Tax=Tengunoibacter tsumagoiensis TaxID=2014871 RepID=A0A402A1P8_9CHLR|nr:DUF72 domain-containing protein [Tengunoibacter tsumagoiensis]GCE12985.1 hypothetical protein KTT_28440 [Tengunoibacter tsumagoiensis]
MFYIGCPMWGYKDWVGHGRLFPARTPTSDFLRLYSQKLTTVEGNTIFYALPSPETITRWAQEAPAHFRFCPKVSRTISHEGELQFKQAETLAFIQRMQGFGERLGPIFLQLPPAFGPSQLENLHRFLAFWPAEVRLAVEVRHAEFYQPEASRALNELLEHYHVARVMMDTRPIRVGSAEEQQVLQARERKPDLPLQRVITTDFTFIRYIGHPRMDVNEPLLDEWAQHCAHWLKEGRTLYVFCHCPYEEHSPAICYALYQRVKALFPLPTLSWRLEPEEPQPEQLQLF